jgi:hypothetical protein
MDERHAAVDPARGGRLMAIAEYGAASRSDIKRVVDPLDEQRVRLGLRVRMPGGVVRKFGMIVRPRDEAAAIDLLLAYPKDLEIITDAPFPDRSGRPEQPLTWSLP